VLSKLEEAITHKSTKTHAGKVFVMTFDLLQLRSPLTTRYDTIYGIYMRSKADDMASLV